MASFRPSRIVTLLTDFGYSDTYVGQMKGVLLEIDPALRIVDLTHGVGAQDVDEGAFQLAAAVGAFPPGTVHVAVVDPGVGTDRRAVVLEAPSAAFVGPDNGIFSHVLADCTAAFEVDAASYGRSSTTATFHGRDVFAPAAGLIASGRVAPKRIGPRIDIDRLVRRIPHRSEAEGQIIGAIVSIDRFGNCITLINGSELPGPGSAAVIECGDFRTAAMSRTYAEVAPGSPVALIGSYGTLELSIRDGSAAGEFGLARGDLVYVRMREISPV